MKTTNYYQHGIFKENSLAAHSVMRLLKAHLYDTLGNTRNNITIRLTILCFILLTNTKITEASYDLHYANTAKMSSLEYLTQTTPQTQPHSHAYEYNVNLKLTGLVSLGYLLYRNDDGVRRWVSENKSDDSVKWSEKMEYLGRPTALFPLLGTYAIGTLTKNRRLTQVSIAATTSWVLGQSVTTIIKRKTGRVRPRYTHDSKTWGNEYGRSFPSGHTTAAFSIATSIATIYSDKPMLGAVSYGLATLTAYSRVHDDAHWASDVLIGALVGYYSSKSALKILGHTSDKENQKSDPKVIIRPRIHFDTAQIVVEYTFNL